MNNICIHCGNVFFRKQKANRSNKFCHISCCRAHHTAPAMDRFMDKVIPEPMSGCWLWIGDANGLGYGWFKISLNKKVKAHRAAWMLFRGENPGSLGVLHKCDTPPCVNLDHLFLGTQKDNVRDGVKKGRWIRGSRVAGSVLKERQIPEIRELIKAGMTHAKIGEQFGVGRGAISRIAQGKNWRYA